MEPVSPAVAITSSDSTASPFALKNSCLDIHDDDSALHFQTNKHIEDSLPEYIVAPAYPALLIEYFQEHKVFFASFHYSQSQYRET